MGESIVVEGAGFGPAVAVPHDFQLCDIPDPSGQIPVCFNMVLKASYGVLPP